MHIGQVQKLAFVSMMGMVSGQWEDMAVAVAWGRGEISRVREELLMFEWPEARDRDTLVWKHHHNPNPRRTLYTAFAKMCLNLDRFQRSFLTVTRATL